MMKTFVINQMVILVRILSIMVKVVALTKDLLPAMIIP